MRAEAVAKVKELTRHRMRYTAEACRQVAPEYGVTPNTVHKWVTDARKRRYENMTPEELQAEQDALLAQIAELEKEKEEIIANSPFLSGIYKKH